VLLQGIRHIPCAVLKLESFYIVPCQTAQRSVPATLDPASQVGQVSVGALKGATHGRFAGGIFWFFCTLAPFGGQLCYSLSVTDPVGALAPFETFSRELSR
jgi:hypothetical protein